jgi:hypothetical protein
MLMKGDGNMTEYPKQIYNPRYLSTHLTPEQARAEYKTLRKRAMNRKYKMQKIFPKSQFLRDKMSILPTANKLDDSEIYSALSDAAYVLRSKYSTISGQRKIMKEQIETFHAHTFTFVNEVNYWDFIDFLDRVKAQIESMHYDSGRAIDLYERFTSVGVSADELLSDFDNYMQNYSKVMELDPTDYPTQKSYLKSRKERKEKR